MRKNPQNATVARNIGAARKRHDVLRARVRRIEHRVRNQGVLLVQVLKRLQARPR